jgi:hypothetical protein
MSPLSEAEQAPFLAAAGQPDNRLASCLAELSASWPELAAVIRAWDCLPETSRRAILALCGGS